MPTKHETIHPTTGEKSTRTSQNRVYSHAVWVRETTACRRQNAIDQLVMAEKNIVWAKAQKEQFGADAQPKHQKTTWGQMVEDYGQLIVRLTGQLDAGTFEPGPWKVEGWCSRDDLARKKASALSSQSIRSGYDKHPIYEGEKGKTQYEVAISLATVVGNK